MSDLLDLVGDLAGGMLEPGLRRRAAATEPPPTPPGIPALPPDPRLISQGLAAIRAHDPGFDESGVLAQARAIWAQGGGGAARLTGLAVSGAQTGGQRERLTVRLELAEGRGVREEDWVFERSASATTRSGDVTGHCPGCGAPLPAVAAAACPYCQASLVGTSTWVLSERLQLRPMTDRDATALALVAAVGAGGSAAPAAAPAPPPPAADPGVDLAVLGPGVDAHDLLGTAREIVYAVAAARSRRHPELVAGRVTPELATALREEASSLAAGRRHHVLAFLEVTDAVITGAAADGSGWGVTVRVRLSGEEYELADTGLELVEGSQTMRSWSEVWTLVRAGAGEPWCAASSERVSEPPGSA
ncbi:MAG TPA: hypothetical protein VH134_01390 [Candidatus Dormibacteraeota bacterium]|jgi:predicted lipid-binding transport protein (Tim44 family)|nr:hypothetical protein [Candidatus Dormibacteraeota bacterium]